MHLHMRVRVERRIFRWAEPLARAASAKCVGENDAHVTNKSGIRYETPVFCTWRGCKQAKCAITQLQPAAAVASGHGLGPDRFVFRFLHLTSVIGDPNATNPLPHPTAAV